MTGNNTQQQKTFADASFDELDLDPRVQEGLKSAGFAQMTPIQAQSLPLALAGKDVAGQGQTGTGKTAAFLIAAFHRLLAEPKSEQTGNDPRAIIIAPTRELAIQIHRDAEMLGGSTGLTFALAYGGIDYEKQRQGLVDGCDILIGTPGRIIDYFKQKVFTLRHIKVCILDEADRMFDLGFIKDIRYLLRRMPEPTKRLNLLFSATLSYRVTELAYEHMNDPVRVEIEAETPTADRVRQVIFYPANPEKVPLLIGLLRSMDPRRTMVFCNTKAATERVCGWLVANGFEAAILSGDVRQKKRQSLLERFHRGDLPILVATDVAARGLHIPDVSHVINYDLPQDAEDYVHRVGRTARLGSRGDALSFACEDYAFHLPDIEDYIGAKIDVEPVADHLADELNKPPPRARRRTGPGGRKPKPGPRSGKGRSRSRRGGDKGSTKGKATSDQPAKAAEQETGSADAPKKKRRRRRRKPKTQGDGAAKSPSNP